MEKMTYIFILTNWENVLKSVLICESCFFQDYQHTVYLTLIGMRRGTFHPLSILDQTLSAEFLPKISKLFWRWKLTSIGLIWHPAKLIESYIKCT